MHYAALAAAAHMEIQPVRNIGTLIHNQSYKQIVKKSNNDSLTNIQLIPMTYQWLIVSGHFNSLPTESSIRFCPC